MTIPNYQFNPVDGYLNSSVYKNPTTEAEARAQINDLVFQVLGALNDYKNKLVLTTDNSSGADNIGATPIAGIGDINTDTVQELIEALKVYVDTNFTSTGNVYTKVQIDTMLQTIVLGQIPDGSLIDIKLSNNTGQIKDIVATNTTNTTNVQNNLTAHLADFTLQVPYAGTTTGTVNTYAIAIPAIIALTVGMAVSLKFNIDSTLASTLNWNGLGAKGIKKANGTNVTNLKATGIYTLRYDGTNFILQGEGASGNAIASDLITGKTATTDAGEITGTLDLSNLLAANVKVGTTINGVAGTFTNDANAVNIDIASSKTAYVNGIKITGTSNKKGYATGTISSSGSTLPFMNGDSVIIDKYPVTVSGLSFTPSVICINSPSGQIDGTTCNKTGMDFRYPNAKIQNLQTSGSFALDGIYAYENFGGFRMPVNFSNTSYTWSAWE